MRDLALIIGSMLSCDLHCLKILKKLFLFDLLLCQAANVKFWSWGYLNAIFNFLYLMTVVVCFFLLRWNKIISSKLCWQAINQALKVYKKGKLDLIWCYLVGPIIVFLNLMFLNSLTFHWIFFDNHRIKSAVTALTAMLLFIMTRGSYSMFESTFKHCRL